MADDDIVADGRKVFALMQDAETDNRKSYEDDTEFARHEKQWPGDILKQREIEARPALTISKMNAFIRQVVNDARQNKPSIKVHPADSGADPDTADVINGLIRNIEYTSNADVAYDTAMECAVAGGFGYWRIGLDYAYHDSFDMDLSIQRIANPLSVYGDPYSTAADSSDWMDAFVVDLMSETAFKAKYGETKTIRDWDDTSWHEDGWRVGNEATVAEWWHREETEVKVQQFVNHMTGALLAFTEEDIKKSDDLQLGIEAGVIEFKRERMAKTYRVSQRTMTGAEVLKNEKWAGCYIPIVPVYGDEYNIKGKRYFRSLIHSAKDAQRQFNYWRTAATELVALAPRAPYLVEAGAVDNDIERWNTANTISHPFLEYAKGSAQPIRQPLDGGVAAGALQEALNASDDMKAVMGLYDASLGARSNETSGKAIMARQREGDVSTFHFTDNLNRAIRHTGRILIDLIPHVYSGDRIVRVMGEDGKPETRPLNQQYPKTDPKTGQPVTNDGQPPAPDKSNVVMAMHDLSAGKYDLTVKAGPSYTTQREEIVENMTALIQAYPPAAPVIGPEMIRHQDWPGADKAADKLEEMASGQLPPELQKQIEDGKQKYEQKIGQLEQDNQGLKQDQQNEQLKLMAAHKQAMEKQASDEQLAREKIASDERIARERIEMEKRLAVLKDDGVETEGPDGKKTIKTKGDVANEGIMQGLQMLGELIVKQGETQMQGMQQIASIIAAPSELVVDPATGRKRAQKVLN